MLSNNSSSSLCLISDSADFLSMMGHHAIHHEMEGPISNMQETCCMKSQASNRQVLPNCRWRTVHGTFKKSPLYLSRHILLNQKDLLPVSRNKDSKKLLQRALSDLAREFWKIQFPILKINHPKKIMLIIKRMIRKKNRPKFTNKRRKKKKGNILGCYKGTIKSSIYVHPDCHTTCQDRLLKVSEASCAAKHGRQTLALFSSRVNRNEHQHKYLGRGTVLHWRTETSPFEGSYCIL